MNRPATLSIVPDGDRSLRIARRFAAPRALVWRAFTEADLIVQWLWARDAPMTACDQDFRVGGRYRWEWTMPDGSPLVVAGRFVEIVPEERIVHTELFAPDWTGGETTVTTVFRDQGDATRIEMTLLYVSPEARDMAARSGMADGMEETYGRLDTLLPGWT